MASSFFLPNLSDTDDDAFATAVDAVIAEATDLCALEQIAALNTAQLSDSNLLPSHIESRFRKLKSLPASFPDSSSAAALPSHRSLEKGVGKENLPDERKFNRAQTMPNPPSDPQKPEEPIPVREGCQADVFSLESEGTLRKKEPKSKSGFGSLPSFSAGSPRGSSPSPPRQRCCLSFSPKRAQRRKVKGDDDILAELGLRSLKEEHRKLKKALKEQERVMRETQKMVKSVKQASARMNAAAIDESMSDVDDEELK